MGTYSVSESYGCSHPTEEIKTPNNKNCWEREKRRYQESSRYGEITSHYINPHSMTTIDEFQKQSEPNVYVQHHTTIHTADGKSYTTSLSREKIMECAQKAVETGNVIDLIA